MERSYYWFAYPTNVESRRKKNFHSVVDLHRLRDGTMAHVLGGHLARNRYRFGGVLLNLDSTQSPSVETPYRESLPALKPRDFVLVSTRPPLDDDEREKRKIRRSNTDFETLVFAGMRRCFSVLSRGCAWLMPDVGRRLEEAEKYARVDFRVKDGATMTLNGAEDEEDDDGATLGYLAAVPLKGGGRVLAAFGMGGVETFLWSQLLAKRNGLIDEFIREEEGSRLRIDLFHVPNDIKYPWYEHSETELRCGVVADVRF